MRAELLLTEDMAQRGIRIIEALAATAPIEVRVRKAYVGDCDILVTYGTGHPVRRPWWEKHRKRGGRCIGWDLGYWNRVEPDASMRVTLDTDHPPQWIRPESAERWEQGGPTLRDDAGDGPIVLIGEGRKSREVRRESPLQWETKMLPRLRAAHPGREIVYRPKRSSEPCPRKVRIIRDGDIEQALKGASLVVCRHSNVAVDACIAGIPVVCESGAASALYGNNVCSPSLVTPSQRQAFLHSLAWWNWRPSEAAQAWTYLLSRIESG